jgi:hypothetical protein
VKIPTFGSLRLSHCKLTSTVYNMMRIRVTFFPQRCLHINKKRPFFCIRSILCITRKFFSCCVFQIDRLCLKLSRMALSKKEKKGTSNDLKSKIKQLGVPTFI